MSLLPTMAQPKGVSRLPLDNDANIVEHRFLYDRVTSKSNMLTQHNTDPALLQLLQPQHYHDDLTWHTTTLRRVTKDQSIACAFSFCLSSCCLLLHKHSFAGVLYAKYARQSI